MRPVLLLVSLLVSELSLPGDETWVWDDFCRTFCRKLLLSRLKSSGVALELVLIRNEDACVCFQRDCMYLAEQLRLRRSSLYWECSLHDNDTNQDLTGIIPNNQFPSLEKMTKHFTFLTSACRWKTAACGLPVSQTDLSVWTLADLRAAPLATASFCGGKRIPVLLVKSNSLTASLHHQFSAFLLEKIPDTHLLTKSCCITATVIISYRTENWKIKSATRNKNASVQVVAEPRVSPTERKTPAMHIKTPLQVEIQRHAVRKTKKNKYLQKLLGKVAFKVPDEVSVQRQLLLVSRAKKGSRNSSAQDDTKYSRKKKSRKHEELQHLQEESKVQQKQRVLTTNNKNVDEGHVLSDVEDEALIMLLLPQRKPLNERKPDLNPAVKPETMRIILKEVGDPPPIIKTVQHFVTGADTSICKCFRGRKDSFKLHETVRTQIMELKPAEKTESRETDVNKAKINTHNPDEDLILPSPPSVKVIPAETTSYSTKATHTTNTEAFSQDSPHGQPQRDQQQTSTTAPEPQSQAETSFTNVKSENTQVTSKAVFSGLRMREDIQEVITKLHNEHQNEPRMKPSFKHSDFRGETRNHHSKTTGSTVPVCTGLIHRTESGWKHCMERLGRPPALVSTQEAPDVGEMGNTPVSKKNPFSNEDEHFYYFNEVLKKVPNPFHVYSKWLKLRRRSSGTTEGQHGDTQ